jgi:hypothetical protein
VGYAGDSECTVKRIAGCVLPACRETCLGERESGQIRHFYVFGIKRILTISGVPSVKNMPAARDVPTVCYAICVAMA